MSNTEQTLDNKETFWKCSHCGDAITFEVSASPQVWVGSDGEVTCPSSDRPHGPPVPDDQQDAHGHVEHTAKQAGLEIMGHVMSIILDREEIPEEAVLDLSTEDYQEFYEGLIGPAIDKVQRSLEDAS